ncbi:MAG TPA: hypothetical protein VMN36_08425 [Verrucomicrobiales bacterium]|nr:hypothetical protein [Verrucomicrobiales bacterium]
MISSSFFSPGSGEWLGSGGESFPGRAEDGDWICGWDLCGGGVKTGDRIEYRRKGVARRILEWMGDWPHLRAEWHRAVDRLDLRGSAGGNGELEQLMRGVAEFRMQFPFGLGPERAEEALLLQDRVAMLYSELVNLRVLSIHRGRERE